MGFRNLIDSVYKSSEANFDAVLNNSIEQFETRIEVLKDRLESGVIKLTAEERSYREATSDMAQLTPIQKKAILRDIERMEILANELRGYSENGRQNFIDNFLTPSTDRIMDNGRHSQLEICFLRQVSELHHTAEAWALADLEFH